MLGGIAVVVIVAAGVLFMVTRSGDRDDASGPQDVDGEIVKNDDPLMSYLIEFVHRTSGDTIDDAEAECMAGNVVTALERDRLIDAGVLQEENPLYALRPDEAETFIRTGFDCLDDAALVDYMAATWNPERFGGLPDDIAPCLYGGWIEGWSRSRAIEIFGKLANPETAPQLDSILDETEKKVLTDVTASCAQAGTTSTTAAAG